MCSWARGTAIISRRRVTNPDVTIKFLDPTALTPYLELDIADELDLPERNAEPVVHDHLRRPDRPGSQQSDHRPSMALPPQWACPWTYNGTSWQTSGMSRVAQSWSANGGAPDFDSVVMPGGASGSAVAPPTVALFDVRSSGPMLYQVSDSRGVVAQGTYTSTVTPPGTVALGRRLLPLRAVLHRSQPDDLPREQRPRILPDRVRLTHSDLRCGLAGSARAAELAAPTVPPSVVPTPGIPTPQTVRCVVPSLKSKTLSRAKTTLTRAHCRVGNVRRPRKTTPGHAFRVVAQSARPRTVHIRGFRVGLTLR